MTLPDRSLAPATPSPILPEFDERFARRALVGVALGGLAAGAVAWLMGRPGLAGILWGAGTVPVVIALAVSMVRDLIAGRLGVDAVALLSMTAALVLGEALAAAVVAVMYAGGSVLEDFAVARAERSLKALVDRAPRIAHVRHGDVVDDIPVERVVIGDVIVVRAGQVIPVDGSVASARAVVDEQAVTGEPLPVDRTMGEAVRSGTVNAGDTFELRATATAGESTYAGIVRMVAAAQTAKAPFIRLADRYALLLLPTAVFVAGLAWYVSGDVVRGLAVLVAATPCPLILAAPVAFISGVSRAASRGILIKGGAALEALARARTVMFDKTGTLTVGGARLVAIETAPGIEAMDVLRDAASLEQASHHVVAQSIVAAARARGLALTMPEEVRETMGSGLEGRVAGKRVRIGSERLVAAGSRLDPWTTRALRRASWRSALCVLVAVDGRVVGALLLADQLRPETPRAVEGLRACGVNRIVMVTGDRADTAEAIAVGLDLDAVLADRTPEEKVEAVAHEQQLGSTIMVGDGINDAPALAAADIGIALGARGASASSEAADVVVLVDRLDRIAEALAIARRSRGIAVQSIVAGMTLSGLAMLAAAAGYLTPVAGALCQEAIDVAVILNALRALGPGRQAAASPLSDGAIHALHEEHRKLERDLDRLRAIADALDEASLDDAATLIGEASGLVTTRIVPHERDDEAIVYPSLRSASQGRYGLIVMSRAHREIHHLARLLARISDGMTPATIDRHVVRDGQRVIEALEALVRLHSAQEDDIYERATT